MIIGPAYSVAIVLGAVSIVLLIAIALYRNVFITSWITFVCCLLRSVALLACGAYCIHCPYLGDVCGYGWCCGFAGKVFLNLCSAC